MATSTFAPLPCIGTYGVPYQSTKVLLERVDASEMLNCQHICFQPEYAGLSAEELRIQDYRAEMNRKGDEMLWKLENHHIEAMENPPQRPRVRLPAVTGGIVNPQVVTKLQDELDRKELELRELRDRTEREKQDAAEQIRATFWKDLSESKDPAKGDGSELTYNQVYNFLETNALARGCMDDKVKLLTINEKEKSKAEYAQVLKKAKDTLVEDLFVGTALELSEEQLRDLLSSRKTIRSIILQNLKKYLDVRSVAVEYLKSEHLESMKVAAERAESMKTQAVFRAETNSAFMISVAENKAVVAMAKIADLEDAAQNSPGMTVNTMWKKIQSTKYPEVDQSTSLDASGHSCSGSRCRLRFPQEDNTQSSNTLPNPFLKWQDGEGFPKSGSSSFVSTVLANTAGPKRWRENDTEEGEHWKQARVEGVSTRPHGGKLTEEDV